ncbi:MAG: YbaK/EbsC family protein [Patescibacteria group bacterium]|jgi:Ala-tRNA(Pro) deacylase
MAISKKLLSHLDKNKIKYEILKHRTVYTAYDLAKTTKRKLNEIAKTLLVKVDKEYFLVVVPAHYKLDLAKVKKFFKAKKVQIARENEMKTKFNVKPGAITPFGTIHKTGVLVDKALLKVREVIFTAGSFTESLRLKVKDFIKSENAQTGAVGKQDKNKK